MAMGFMGSDDTLFLLWHFFFDVRYFIALDFSIPTTAVTHTHPVFNPNDARMNTGDWRVVPLCLMGARLLLAVLCITLRPHNALYFTLFAIFTQTQCTSIVFPNQHDFKPSNIKREI